MEKDLIHAIRKNKTALIVDILKNGVNVNEKLDDLGNTALYYALTWNSIKILNILLDAGSDINNKNNEGNTPLHVVMKYPRAETVKILLEKGANFNIKNNKGQTPLDLAKETLANINVEDNDRLDLFKKPKEEYFIEVIEILNNYIPDIKFAGRKV